MKITKETFNEVAAKVQEELITLVKLGNELDDYQVILYNYLFTEELSFPILHIEIRENSFLLHVIPDNLTVKHLRLIDDTFDKFELIFMPTSPNKLMILKFIYNGD